MGELGNSESILHAAAERETVDNWDQHWEQFSDASVAHNPGVRYRVRLITRFVAREVRSGRRKVLDVGSGVGDLAHALSEAAPSAKVRGLELSATGVRIASGRVPDAVFHQFDLMSGDRLPDGWDEWADVAVCSEVLEHLDEPVVFLRTLGAALCHGGLLLVTVPGGPRSAFDRHIGHRRHYTRQSLRELLTAAGFDVREVRAAGFPFFNLYRAMVIARGARLVDDVSSATANGVAVRIVGAAFDGLFRANLPRTPFGWQLVAVATRTGGQ